MKNFGRAAVIILVLVASGYFLAKYMGGQEQREVASTEFDQLVLALREKRNRLEVSKLSGTVTTISHTKGGLGGVLHGTMKVKQPWSVSYFIDMGDLTLQDYIWDAKTRTLIVRAPAVAVDPPNIDETKQVVQTEGFIVTRDMQNRLRSGIANGAKKQAALEAAKPENMAAAAKAAEAAIVRNLQAPLIAAGIRGASIVVRSPVGGGSEERWDVSRSIADVLATRAAR